MPNTKKFHPGVFIKDSLESLNMSSKEFSARSGISERTLSSLINQTGNITFDIAYNLSKYFGTSINFWTNLQNQFDLYKKEVDEMSTIDYDYKLVKPVIDYFEKYYAVEKNSSHEEIVNQIRKIVGVNYLSSLERDNLYVSYKSLNHEDKQNLFFKNLWISLALKEARNYPHLPYDQKKFKNSLKDIRNLNLNEPKTFYPKLKKIFEECGITLVFLPYLSKTNIYGITKWITSDHPLIAISNRNGRADSFWFTLFHECSHVLMQHRREMLINDEKNIEDEANQFACDQLIEKEEWAIFKKTSQFDEKSILKFSRRNGILPCIVLGRLQKEGLVSYASMTKQLQVYYDFSFLI